MNQLTNPAPTPGTKPHYPILDGLRGVAAILVVIYHLMEGYYVEIDLHPMNHGYLAVDFFFMLSGFVVGYAYDDRWPKMSIGRFFTIRLIRLHPMVVFGIVIGTIAFIFDPYTNGYAKVSNITLLWAVILGTLLLPAPDVRGWGETHPINGPCWTLLQEYIANILYAFFGRRMGKTALWKLVLAAAVVLTGTAIWRGNLGTGWGYDTFWIAVTRMMFPFFAGLLLFRTGKRLHIAAAFPLCSLAMIILFFLPHARYNGLLEAAIIILAFPMLVAAGAGGKISGRWAKLCKFSGDISYPIYITHYPFIYIYTMWIYQEKPAPAQVIPVAIGLFVFFMVLAYAALKLYDEPVRAWLKKKYPGN